MERQAPPKPTLYEKCYIDNPDDFYVVQRLKSDEEVMSYLNNCLLKYDYWVTTRKFPESNQAKLMAWRSEVLKRILIERGLETPSLYDTVFGYEPPVKKRQLKNGLQEEVRVAQQQLKEARARARLSPPPLLHADANDTVPPSDESQGTEPIEEIHEGTPSNSPIQREGLRGFLGLLP